MFTIVATSLVDCFKWLYGKRLLQNIIKKKVTNAPSEMTKNREPADDVLNRFKQNNPCPGTITTSNGAPIGDKSTVLTVGPRGPILLQDVVYLDEMAHFDRERIPERVVHAKGAGAHGYFEVTHDITKYCKAAIFSEVGKRTPMFLRFSTVGGESGSADTARDPRGFAMKFYTEEGNWDLVGNNTPIFFIRDPMLFPNFIHTQKRHPQTHLKDPNMMWDFFTLRPETIHQVMFLFSDRGTPDGFRHMHGFGSHTFKLVNAKNEAVYCKFHCLTEQGIKNLTSDEADEWAKKDPDYAIRDLFNAIEKGDYPAWKFCIQIMTLDEADKHPWNPFDVTKVWPHKDFPLIPVGRIVLNKNPINYFFEVEQAAFAPAHVVPGIEFSPDRMLQGRIFSYTDTHFHRLGPNYIQLPINCPFRTRVANTQRDGLMTIHSQGNAPNHHPNTFNGPVEQPNAMEHRYNILGDVYRHCTKDDDNYTQPRLFWEKVLNEEERQRLINNIVSVIKNVYPHIVERVIEVYGRVHPDFKNGLIVEIEKARREQSRL